MCVYGTQFWWDHAHFLHHFSQPLYIYLPFFCLFLCLLLLVLILLLVCQTFPWLSQAVSSAVTAVWLWLLSSVKSNSKPLAVPQKSLKYRLRWAERETDRIRDRNELGGGVKRQRESWPRIHLRACTPPLVVCHKKERLSFTQRNVNETNTHTRCI